MSLEKYQQKKRAEKDNFSDAGEIALGVGGMHPMTGTLLAAPLGKAALGEKTLAESQSNYWKASPFAGEKASVEADLGGYMDNFPSLKKYAEKNNINFGYGTSPGGFDMHINPSGQKTVRMNARGLPFIMHEMGHAMTPDNIVTRARHGLASKIQNTQNMSTAGKVAAGWGWHLADSAMAPIDEALAWKKAFGIADEIGAPTALKKMMMKKAIPAYGSYLARSLPVLGGAALAAHGIYDALTDD